MSLFTDFSGYYRELESLDDIKYFIDRWARTQESAAQEKAKVTKKGKKESTKEVRIFEPLEKQEIVLGHTIFTINIKKNVTSTKCYIVACTPYHSDLDAYEDSEDKIYTGECDE